MEKERILIVGASSGIGFEVASLLCRQKNKVVVAARRQERMQTLVDIAPERVSAVRLDVNASDVSGQVAEIIEGLGGIDLLVYVAGIGSLNMELDAGIEESTVVTNVVGFTKVTVAVYNYMASHEGGHIAVVSSIAGTKGLGAAPSYSASKAFQNTYIEALAQQSRMRGACVSFTDIRPGFVATDLLGGDMSYPMLMDKRRVSLSIVRAIEKRRSVVVIDWRWRALTCLWRLVPRSLWLRMRISK